MPVGSVNSIPLVEIHHIRDIGKIITWSAHTGITILYIDAVLTANGGVLAGSS